MITLLAQLASPRGLGPCPPSAWATLHPRSVPIVADLGRGPRPTESTRVGYSTEIGRVLHLERSDAGVMAVGLCDVDAVDLLDDGDWFAAPVTRGVGRNDGTSIGVRLGAVTLQRSAPEIGAAPIVWSRSDLSRDVGLAPPRMRVGWYGVWERGAEILGAPSTMRASHLVLLDLDRCAHNVRVRAAADRAKPKPVAVAGSGPGSRVDAAKVAAAAGVRGYSYLDGEGQRRYVRAEAEPVAVGD